MEWNWARWRGGMVQELSDLMGVVGLTGDDRSLW